jgi:RNA-directed DNA polymerase
MEEALGVQYRKDGTGRTRAFGPVVVRYADDFAVVCTTREEADWAINRLTPWLAERGLTFSEEKTRIVHITDGFNFLGYNLRQYRVSNRRSGHILLIKPSRESVMKLRQRLREEWLALRGHRTKAVLARLNPILRGWANYFRNGVSKRTFARVDHWMFQREVRYVNHKHPTKPWYWKKRRYWGRMHRQRQDNWVFGDKDSGHILLQFSWFPIVRHTQVKGTASPDDPALHEYWEARQAHPARTLSPSRQRIARNQQYACDVCGDSLFNDEELHLHHQQWRSRGGTDAEGNLVFRHLYCHQQLHGRKEPDHEQAGSE